jgi:hypothetical protein
MATNVLTPLQLIAGASLLQNQGLSISPELSAAIDAYSNTAVMTAFFEALAQDSSLATLAANSVPAFSNSFPGAYANLGTQMSNTIVSQANIDFGSGDVSKFVQALNVVEAYTINTNIFVNSAVNSQTYLGNTFTSMNNMITGDVTTINLATTAFGQDLINMGGLIDLNDLDNLGSPFALIQRVVSFTGNIPVLSLLLLAEGVTEDIVLNLNDPTLSVSDSVQRLMYQAMTKITGSDLEQILKVLRVTTLGIETMADLLNPVKIFPNSYLSMTVTTANGIRGIYLNQSGAVNTSLEQELPSYVIGNNT